MRIETLDCLKDCSGACCKILLIPIRGYLPDDYLQARDLSILDFEGHRFLWLKHPCKYLTETGGCSIHNNGKPLFCKSQEAGCFECRACRELLKTER